MEICINDHPGLPDDTIVSIRFGPTRRQATLKTVREHPMKFPTRLETCCEPLKIDVLQQLHSTRLVLQSEKPKYRLGLGGKLQEGAAGASLGLDVRHVGVKADDGEKRDLNRHDAGINGIVKLQDSAAASARDYLEEHGILRYVQALLHAVIQLRPADPFAFMVSQLSAAEQAGPAAAAPGAASPEVPAAPVAQPQQQAAPVPRLHLETLAAAPPPVEPPVAPPATSPPPLNAEEEHEPEVARQKVLEACEMAFGGAAPEEGDRRAVLEALEAAAEDEQLKKKSRENEPEEEEEEDGFNVDPGMFKQYTEHFEEIAKESGKAEIEQASDSPGEAGPVNEVESARLKMKQALELAAADDTLSNLINAANAQDRQSPAEANEIDMEDARVQLRNLLMDATESGTLASALESILKGPPSSQTPEDIKGPPSGEKSDDVKGPPSGETSDDVKAATSEADDGAEVAVAKWECAAALVDALTLTPEHKAATSKADDSAEDAAAKWECAAALIDALTPARKAIAAGETSDDVKDPPSGETSDDVKACEKEEGTAVQEVIALKQDVAKMRAENQSLHGLVDGLTREMETIRLQASRFAQGVSKDAQDGGARGQAQA